MGVLDSLKVIISGDSSGATAAANQTAVALERTTVAQANLERESAKLAAKQAQAGVAAARQAGDTEALAVASNNAAAAQLRLAEATAAAGVAQAKASVSRATRDVQNLGTATTATGGAVGTLGKAATSLAVAGVATGAVAGALKSVIDASSALEEQQSATNITFGEGADEVRSFAETASESFGLSERAALQAGNSFAALFKAGGLNEADVARMSTSLTRLGSDLASFKDIGTEDALNALRSGLTGEVEPLRRLGIILNDTTVTAKALELGLGDLNGNVDDGAKVAARYAIILEQTKDAQGNYALTAEDTANAQRTLNAEMENFRATLGKDVSPIFAQLVGDMTTLIGAADTLATHIGGLKTVFDGLLFAFAPLTSVMHKAIGLFGDHKSAAEKSAEAQATYNAEAEAATHITREFTSSLEDQTKAMQAQESAVNGTLGALSSYESAVDAVATAEEGLAKARGGFAEKTREQAEATADMRAATVDAATAQQELNRAQRDAPLEIADAQNEAAAAATTIAEKTRAVTVAIERFGKGSLEARDAQDELAASITDSAQATQKAKDLAESGGRTPDVLTAERAVATAKERQAKAAEDKIKADALDPAEEIRKAEEKVADAKDRQVLAELNLLQSLGKYNTQFGTTLTMQDTLLGKLDDEIIKRARILIEQEKLNAAQAAQPPPPIAPALTPEQIARREAVLPAGTTVPAPASENPFVQKYTAPVTNITVNAKTDANPQEIAREVAFVGRSRVQ